MMRNRPRTLDHQMIVKLSRDQHDAAKAQARDDGVSLSWVVRRVVADYVAGSWTPLRKETMK